MSLFHHVIRGEFTLFKGYPEVSWLFRAAFVLVIVNGVYPLVVGGDLTGAAIVLGASGFIANLLDILFLHPHRAPWNLFRPVPNPRGLPGGEA